MKGGMGVDDVVLSVRDLVEFILRSGSIDNRFSGFDRAQMGARIHRQLQKNAGPDYSAEVTLKDTTTTKGITFFVQGRADGIIRNALGVTIDEIKTTAMDLALLEEEDRPVHWAQAKCYAWFVAKEEGLSSISVRLTYCQIETRETRFFTKVFRYEALEAFYLELLEEYLCWARMKEAWGKMRDQSAGDLEFPYPEYRRGQREMAVAVYNTIRRQERLFCQAPTGIGKTLSVLFPSIKALAQGFGHRVFYLTAKTITRQVAEETVALLRQKGLRIKCVTLTAKDKICFLEERSCNPE
ncbi:MAG: ATP-dependent DNA helicase, partial [Eubacterium sp.]